MDLKDKGVIVTGAASGIGREIARQLHAAGAKVAVADLNVAGARAVAAEFDPGGEHALGVAMDVTDEDEVDSAVAIIARRFGGIDVLISNAGIELVAPIEELEFADWKRVLAVYLDGAFLTTRACLRCMYAQRRGGSVIYIGSVHSKEASELKAAYVSAKHGLEGLCKVVAKEGARHGVRSNIICPGFVRTPLVDKQIPEQAGILGISEHDVVQQVMLRETVDGEFTTLDDVARTAVFLAGFPTNALTGQSIVVSHGWHME
ncbi:MAG TPA: 3-hydroxybutyrate dehydrogenase [Rhizomicrobium sp.]|nr:3-hydroxybutyrate dehydrogenase [Rhizomicrobium sp.]